MSLVHISWSTKLRGLAKYAEIRLHQRPVAVTIELTRRCNARSDYCGHWQEPRRRELDTEGFIDVVRWLDPLIVTICGGEPFMRPDVLDVLGGIRALPGFRYLAIITNGW